jgi:ComF family protein
MHAKRYFQDLVSFFYPGICPGCELPLQGGEPCLCLFCELKLPVTGFVGSSENPVEKIFRGRLEIEQGNAFMYFRKKGLAQKLMHDLKYNGNRDLGNYLGKLFARKIMNGPAPCMPDLLTTVPIHSQKMLKRGFNQSDEIARGFASVSGIPFEPGILIKTQDTGTQTRKKRYERWENTGASFRMHGKLPLEGRHVGIMDDVITTGATLESCGQKLKEVTGVRISIFSLCISIN